MQIVNNSDGFQLEKEKNQLDLKWVWMTVMV